MIRKTLLVISIVLLVGTVGLWVRSYRVGDRISWVTAEYGYSFSSFGGRMWAGFEGPPVRELKGFRHIPDSNVPPASWSALYRFARRFTTKSIAVEFPHWFPVGLLGVLAYVLGRPLLRARHRRRHNLCVKCGYSLEGNVSGTCPECGTVVVGSETEST